MFAYEFSSVHNRFASRTRVSPFSIYNGNVSDDDAFRVAIPYQFLPLFLCISFVKVNFYK